MTELALKPSQLFEFLIKAVPAKENVLIKGAPGTGKTDIGHQVSHHLESDLVLMHPVVSDPTDFKGIPWVFDHEGSKKAVFLPTEDLEKLMTATKLTIAFPDDVGQAPPAVQAALMQLLLSRSINGHKISDHVAFIAATNRKADKAGVSGMLEPVKSRFSTIVELMVDVDDWVTWALANNVPTELIAFIRYRPNLLHDFKPTSDLTNSPCPRTVTNAGRLMQLGLPKDVELPIFAGACGEGWASEFMAFLQISRQLITPDMILMNPNGCDVPTKPAALYATTVSLASKASETMRRPAQAPL